jgi:hypothetical protein
MTKARCRGMFRQRGQLEDFHLMFRARMLSIGGIGDSQAEIAGPGGTWHHLQLWKRSTACLCTFANAVNVVTMQVTTK